MNGYRTSLVALFREPADGRPRISSVEIPIIQRDFAQGRAGDAVGGIRDRFLDVLTDAVSGGDPVDLDFIYGEVVDDGVLRPLDGQQRLTTLLLLHWYLASRAAAFDPDLPWLRFSYATRPSARDFCDVLRRLGLPSGAGLPSEWITDQPWYIHPWRSDPTIQSMLVMLDGIHLRFSSGGMDFAQAWDRLVDLEHPAISFLFLPIENMVNGDELYIKMNSRGRPLTRFEVFKSELESVLQPELTVESYSHLVRSLDGEWPDLLWQYERRGDGDFDVDHEFMRYFEFVVDVCEWRDGAPDRRWLDADRSRERTLEGRSRLAFSDAANPLAERNRAFLFHAFDTWIGPDNDPTLVFSRLLTAGGRGDGPLPLLASTDPDLFGACIAGYGGAFTLTETLMLFAVLTARRAGIDGHALDRRLRSLRNLTESWNLDSRRVTDYIAATEKLIVEGTLDESSGFNQGWVADEVVKWKLMDDRDDIVPSIHELEDDPIIRGRLLAFDLDPAFLPTRAAAFVAISDPSLRDELAAALLTKGDYSRDMGWDGARRQLGSSQSADSWRDLLTATTRAEQTARRVPLTLLLDDVAHRMQSGERTAGECLVDIRGEWLAQRTGSGAFDWRWYLVKYRGARSGRGPGYYHGDYDPIRGGFKVGGLHVLDGTNYNAYFSDAILSAIWNLEHLDGAATVPRWWHRDDPGLEFADGRVELKNRDEGFEIVLHETESIEPELSALLSAFGPANSTAWVAVPQVERDGVLVDEFDRVERGAIVARELAAAIRTTRGAVR